MSKANVNNLAYIGSKPTDRKSNEWYTPVKYIEAARSVLGWIDLDPMSSATANKTVKAKRYYDEEANAFDGDWECPTGTLWMNPPYGRGIISDSINMFLEQYRKGNFNHAIVLVNNATETIWFQDMLSEARAVCFPDHRIAFDSPDEKQASCNTRGQAFLFFSKPGVDRGVRLRRFNKIFGAFGTVMKVNS